MLIDIKMKKKSIAEFGHNGCLKIYVDPKNFTSTLAFMSIFPSMSMTLMLIGIKKCDRIRSQ